MAAPKEIKFSNQLFDDICEVITTSSIGLAKICKEYGVSYGSFYSWMRQNDELVNRYTRAREMQADYLAEQILEIADDSSQDELNTDFGVIENKEFVNRSKLRVEARKWIAAKLKPKKYGDKIDHTTDGEKIASVDITELVQTFMNVKP